MTKDEFDIITKIVDENVANKDALGLTKVISYIQSRLDSLNACVHLSELEENEFLTQTLDEFFSTSNFTKEELKRIRYKTFKVYMKNIRYGYIKTDADIYRFAFPLLTEEARGEEPIRLYEIIGAKRFYYVDNQIGYGTIDMIERKLNQYGLSLFRPLSEEKLEELKRYVVIIEKHKKRALIPDKQ